MFGGWWKMIFGSCVGARHAKCIWWNSCECKSVLWPFTTRVINCKLFFVARSSAVSFFRCTFYHLLQFMCGGRFVHLPHSTPHRSIDSSISGMARKKTSLYSKLLMQFFMFRCCVFTFSANTHSHVHQHRQYSPTQLFFFISLFSAPDANLYFCPARPTLFDSLMVKWLYGLVWSVVCYFNFLCLLLAAAGWCCGDGRTSGEGKKCILFMCGIFSMMMVVCKRGRKK